MEQTSDNDKDMEYRMYITLFLAYAVKYCAYRVTDTAEEKKSESSLADRLYYDRKNGGNNPTDSKIQHHSQNLEFFKVFSIFIM